MREHSGLLQRGNTLRSLNLKIDLGKNPVHTAVFFVYTFLSYATNALGLPSIFIQLSLYSFFAMSALKIITNKVKMPGHFIIWYGTIFCLSILSILYATSQSYAMDIMKPMVMALVFGMSFAVFIKLENGLKKSINCFIISASVVGLYLAFTFKPEHDWSRLGEAFNVNANLVGLDYVIPLCFLFVRIYQRKKMLLYSIMAAICGYNVLLSGSKKALLGFSIFILVYLFFESRGSKRLRSMVILGLLLVGIYFVIMNIPSIYNILGARLEEMIEELFGDSMSAGTSTSLRYQMIEYGFTLFSENQILGVGINNYPFYFASMMGWNTYAHNNYVELLTDLGLIGFVSYYSIHFYLFTKLFKMLDSDERRNASLGLALVALLLFFDIAWVSYYQTRIMTIIVFVLYGVVHRKQSKIAIKNGVN